MDRRPLRRIQLLKNAATDRRLRKLAEANAITKPPKNKKIRWLKYIDETVFPSSTPNAGNNTTGSNAVTASGTASVIHQIAIRIAMASV